MDKKTRTHERILAAASRTLRRDGFHGVTVAAAMKDAGLTHGGFYAHFESQDALLSETLERAGADAYGWMAQAVRDASSERGISPFRALVELYLSETHAHAAEAGCVVAALGTEVPRQSESVRSVARGQVQTLLDRVAEVLPRTASAPTVAATMLGALSMARMLPSESAAALLESVRRDLLDRYEGHDSSR